MENRPRSLFAGGTDYTGVGMDVILAHLRDWRTATSETVQALEGYLKQVKASPDSFDGPEDIRDYIVGFTDLFIRYGADFDRLIEELPGGVLHRHLETLNQIYESSRLHEQRCVRFSSEHINRGLKDEMMRWTLDRIYGDSRDLIIDYRDLSNVRHRLEALVGSVPEVSRVSIDDIDALELKPNVFGIGVNLNHIIKRVRQWFRKGGGRVDP